MLSVLIPVYNFDVVSLVKDLANQCIICKIEFEIICLDDGSDHDFKKNNLILANEPKVIYEELPFNVGRSKIRNQLAEKAKYKNLLFLDCDSSTNDDRFIERYINKIDSRSVIYGGRNYARNKPNNPAIYFRWWYGVNRETINSVDRKKNSYSHFMTNNFCIPKSIYGQIKLNEDLQGYGHEDTLFGIELKQKQVPIIHIDNPLCHIGLEDFETFIHKTEEGINNLNLLINQQKVDESIKLLKAYKLIKKIGLELIIYAYYKKNKSAILMKLQKQKSSLRWFDSYKLGYLVSLRKS